MGRAELQMIKIRAGVIRYKVYRYNNHDVLVDIVHFNEGVKKQISLKLNLCCTNQDQIQNQRPRLRSNTLG